MTAGDHTPKGNGTRLFGMLVGVYLGGGAINATINLLVPRMEMTLHLDHARALLVHLAYYSSYLLFALPVTLWSIRLGHMRAITAGLAIMGAGCIAFAAASVGASYPLILCALLVISLGVTFLQISGNAVTTAFGRSTGMASRYTLLQGFNALGTVLAPLVGTGFILGGAAGRLGPAIPFGVFAVAFLALGGLFARSPTLIPTIARQGPAWAPLRTLALRGSMLAGVLAIFCYVGAEVTLATLAVDYLMRRDSIGVSATGAGHLVSIYWMAAMLGRFGGAFAVRRIGVARLLGMAALGALVLVIVAGLAGGTAGAVALLAVGLCNSVMFPLAYALALPRDEADVPLAAMLLCMAVVGGAVVPLCTGLVADAVGLRPALLVPAACYALVLCFALGHMARNREIAWR